MAGEGPALAFVFGTRPEFIKCAPLIRRAERRGIAFEVIHTGQHYSRELDEIFFEQLDLPAPTYNLEIGSGSPGHQTGSMIAAIEGVLSADEPDVVVVHGDTNSTLAGSVTTCKLDSALAHVEAGLRSGDRSMPEEHNRVLTDHAADLLFAPTDRARDQLAAEGLADGVWVTGNTIVDAVLESRELAAERSDVLERLDLEPGGYVLLTAHRGANVDDPERFRSILEGVARAAREHDLDCVYPAHPRSGVRLRTFGIEPPDPIRVVPPEDFLSFLRLEGEAALVVTDSGGVQEETAVLGTPCVTVRENTERQETIEIGSNRLAGADSDRIVRAARAMVADPPEWESPYGDGRAAERILDVLEDHGE